MHTNTLTNIIGKDIDMHTHMITTFVVYTRHFTNIMINVTVVIHNAIVINVLFQIHILNVSLCMCW